MFACTPNSGCRGSSNEQGSPRTVEVESDARSEGCSDHDDSVLVASHWDCSCDLPACADTPILADEVETYEADVEAAKRRCGQDLRCGDPGECFDEGNRAACVAGDCVLRESGECADDSECDQPRYGGAWQNRDNAVCDSDGICRECRDTGVFEPGGCPAGFWCNTVRCVPLDSCTTPDDCGPSNIEGRGERNLGCVDGYCSLCESDEHCAFGEICMPPHEGEQPALPGCSIETKFDRECLETCPVDCERDGESWACPRYPSVDFPEANDYGNECERDDECVAVVQRRWTNDCVCNCVGVGLEPQGVPAFTSAWPDTKSQYGCDDMSDCDCPEYKASCETDRQICSAEEQQ